MAGSADSVAELKETMYDNDAPPAPASQVLPPAANISLPTSISPNDHPAVDVSSAPIPRPWPRQPPLPARNAKAGNNSSTDASTSAYAGQHDIDEKGRQVTEQQRFPQSAFSKTLMAPPPSPVKKTLKRDKEFAKRPAWNASTMTPHGRKKTRFARMKERREKDLAIKYKAAAEKSGNQNTHGNDTRAHTLDDAAHTAMPSDGESDLNDEHPRGQPVLIHDASDAQQQQSFALSRSNEKSSQGQNRRLSGRSTFFLLKQRHKFRRKQSNRNTDADEMRLKRVLGMGDHIVIGKSTSAHKGAAHNALSDALQHKSQRQPDESTVIETSSVVESTAALVQENTGSKVPQHIRRLSTQARSKLRTLSGFTRSELTRTKGLGNVETTDDPNIVLTQGNHRPEGQIEFESGANSESSEILRRGNIAGGVDRNDDDGDGEVQVEREMPKMKKKKKKMKKKKKKKKEKVKIDKQRENEVLNSSHEAKIESVPTNLARAEEQPPPPTPPQQQQQWTTFSTTDIKQVISGYSAAPLYRGWKDDLKQHQFAYMARQDDHGVFMMELNRKRKADLQERKLTKKDEPPKQLPHRNELLSLANTHPSLALFDDLYLNLEHNRSHLCSLSLENTGLDDTSVRSLALALATNRTLLTLSVARNNLRSDSALALASALRRSTCTQLQALILAHNPIEDLGVAAISAIIGTGSKLQFVDLTNVGAGDLGARHVSTALSSRRAVPGGPLPEHLPTFPCLNYGGNTLTPRGLIYFASAITKNKSVCKLVLDGNVNLGDAAAEILRDLFMCFTSLTEVSLENIGLTVHGMADVLTGCQESETLRVIHLGANNDHDMQMISSIAVDFELDHLQVLGNIRG